MWKPADMSTAFYLIVALTTIVSVLFLAWASTAIIVRALRRGGRREDVTDDHEALAVSRFTIPVSIIVTLEDAASDVLAAVQRLLALDYPEFEIVLIANGVEPDALVSLVSAYGLEAQEFFYRRTLTSSPVTRILRSDREERLIVVEKERSSVADAVNCGIDFARFRFVTAMGPDVVFEGDALLRAMSPALRDPARVLAVSSHIERRLPAHANRWMDRLIARFQRLESVRAIMESRLVWQSLPCAFAPADAVVVWRRDAVLHAGGFLENGRDPVIDLMRRVEASESKNGAHVVRTGEIVGYTSGTSLRAAVETAQRRRRGAWQAGPQLATDPALRTFALVELLTPLASTALLLATLTGAIASWWSAWAPIAAVCTLTLGHAAVSSVALLSRASAPGSPDGPELAHLLLAAPLEYVVYRPSLACLRLASVFRREVSARR